MAKIDLPKVLTIDPQEGRWARPLTAAEREFPVYHVVLELGANMGAVYRAYVEGPFTDDWIDLHPGTLPGALRNIALHLEAHQQTLARFKEATGL